MRKGFTRRKKKKMQKKRERTVKHVGDTGRIPLRDVTVESFGIEKHLQKTKAEQEYMKGKFSSRYEKRETKKLVL